MKLTVAAAELRAVARESSAAKPSARSALSGLGRPLGAAPKPDTLSPIQVKSNTCDLRGLRVDDGVSMATTFLDRALNEGQDVVFLLHGRGTGALREAIRGELARSPYVARFRGEDADRGGDGVTVVWLT